MRSFRQLLALTATGVLGVALTACGGSSSKTAKSTANAVVAPAGAQSAVLASMEKAQSVDGLAMTMEMAGSTREGAFTLDATGTVGKRDGKSVGQMDLSISLPGTASVLGKINTQVIFDTGAGGGIWIKVPSELQTELQAVGVTKPWLSASVSDLSKSGGLSGQALGAFDGSESAAQLQRTYGADVSGAKVIGHATINGEATTIYSETVKSPTSGISAPVTIWVGSDGLPRRVVTHVTQSGTAVTVTVNYTSYGAQPTPTFPSAADSEPLSKLRSLASTLKA